jgi:small subunit ribosomal protein S1
MSWTRRLHSPAEIVSIGDRVEVQVLNVNRERREMSLSMKQLWPDPWARVGEKYPPGTVLTGVVRNLANFGAFVEIEEGVEGLLHVGNMNGIRKIAHPSEVVQPGDQVTCVVLRVDLERRRIGLGLKQMAENARVGDTPDCDTGGSGYPVCLNKWWKSW